jgi:hypothetical protein
MCCCCVLCVLKQGAASATQEPETEAAAATGQWQESDADGPYMRMFWLDASEEQVYINTILLITITNALLCTVKHCAICVTHTHC